MPYLCFDIGTSSVKSAVISESGILLGSGRSPVSVVHGPDGAFEVDPSTWIDSAFSAGCEALSEARSSSRKSEIEIRAIAVSGNGPTLLAVDEKGASIRPALLWMDRRAQAEAEEVSKLVDFPLDPGFYLPKALFLWRSDEELRSRTRWFFSCPEYLAFVLGATAVTYLPSPGFRPYIWDSPLISALGLDQTLFPPFASPSSQIGVLRPESAERLGIASGAPIIAAYPDFLAAIVGSASVDVGKACDRSGSSEALNMCAPRPFADRRLLSLPHPIEGLWNISGGVSTAGAALSWVESLVCIDSTTKPDTSDFHKHRAEDGSSFRISQLASLSPAGANELVFLPYLAGERAPLWDSKRRGAFVGLSLEHTRADIARAACESIAYGLRLAADLARSGGIDIDLIRVSGFSAHDDFLCTLKADILGIPVESPEVSDCELLGDAALCAFFLREASSIADASRSLYRMRRRFERHSSEQYDVPYELFRTALESVARYDELRSQGGRS